MEHINNFILERLKLNNDSKINIRYKFNPKTFKELRSLLEQLLEERGKDADLNDIDVSQVTTFYDIDKKQLLFEGLDPHNINISKWDVSNVEDMSFMFAKCKNFTGQGLEKWKVNKVKDMQLMFCGCENFNCDLSNWDVSNVENMGLMFAKCKNFTGQGLEKWKVNKVKDMQLMFCGCENFNCDLSNWNVSNVEDMHNMFKDSGVEYNEKYPSWYKK